MLQCESEPAYLLHQRPYRDSSLLLEVLTRSHGRQGIIARGARAARSRWRGLLQPFQPLLIGWRARADLGTLTQAEPNGRMLSMQRQPLFAAFYLNELLLRLLPRGDVEIACFEDYVQALQAVADDSLEEGLRIFEKRLLQNLGYGLQLDCDVETGEAIQPLGWYRYIPEHGPIRVSSKAATVTMFRGETLLALYNEHLDDARVLSEAKQLLRENLRIYLGDRPLKTREVLRAMQRDA